MSTFKNKKQNNNTSKFQKYEIQRIHRSQIEFADYNPNKMSRAARAVLKNKIESEDTGLVTAVVWNKKTGRLIGGHHRISILDELEGNQDYSIDVCVVDVDENKEAEINVFLNNKSVQGDYDVNLLEDLHERFYLSFEDMGFTDIDVEYMFGEVFENDPMFAGSDEVQEDRDKVEDIKGLRDQINKSMDAKNKDGGNPEFYFVVVCREEKEREEILNKLGLPRFEKYISSDRIIELLPDSE